MFNEYENRAMNSGPSNKDGLPSSGKCPKCGAPLYYASRLVSVHGAFENVDFCSGGCGFKETPGARDVKDIEDRAAQAE